MGDGSRSADRPTLVPLVVAAILLFGFFARAQTFKTPLFDHHSWRQADTAQIARGFWRDRFNPLFPQIAQRGARQVGYVETGLELYAFGVAALARVSGFHVEIGRLLNCGLFVGSAWLVFRFLRRRYDVETALIGLFAYAFGLPLSLFLDRAFMNEGLLMFLSFSCLVSAQAYVATPNAAAATLLVVASALIGAIKFPYLIVWAPVAGLFLEAGRRRAPWRPLYLMMVVDLGVAYLWYTHAHQLGRQTGLSFGLLDKAFDPALVLSAGYYWRMIARLWKDVLGPVGLIAAAAGLVVCVRRRRWPEVLGAAAFVAYLILVAGGNNVHNYYQVAVVPIGVVLIAVGVRDGTSWLAPTSERRYAISVAAALALMAASTFLRSVSFHSWYEYDVDRWQLCRQLQPQLQARDLMVFVDYPNPDLLFCVDRYGWLFDEGRWTAGDLRTAWQEGASVIVVPDSTRAGAIPPDMVTPTALIARVAGLSAYRLNPR